MTTKWTTDLPSEAGKWWCVRASDSRAFLIDVVMLHDGGEAHPAESIPNISQVMRIAARHPCVWHGPVEAPPIPSLSERAGLLEAHLLEREGEV